MVKPIENTILSEKKFISNASHELKTPLSVISANAELLSSEVGRDNKHLLYIQQETSRMISLVQKMLTLTRLDAFDEEAVAEGVPVVLSTEIEILPILPISPFSPRSP